jgi:hypothetical protein
MVALKLTICPFCGYQNIKTQKNTHAKSSCVSCHAMMDPITTSDIESYQAHTRTTADSLTELKPPTQKSTGLITILTAILCLSLSIGLWFYWDWRGRDIWSQSEKLRPYYTSLCQFFPCQMPIYQNIKAFKIRQTIAQEDIKQSGRLRFDLLLENTAAFNQDFPIIKLSFFDHQATQIESVSLSKADYENALSRKMVLFPAETKIHFTFYVRPQLDNPQGYQFEIASNK